MTLPWSRLDTGLYDGTDVLSPYGNIDWTPDAAESEIDTVPYHSSLDNFGSVGFPSDHTVGSGEVLISYSSYVDMESSSLRASIFEDLVLALIRKGFSIEPVMSRTALRQWLTNEFRSRRTNAIEEEIASLFAVATHITLEPGFSNAFSEALEQTIAEFGEPALHAIAEAVLSERTKDSIAMEALQYVGHAESGTHLNARRKMLERCLLESESTWVRDGAGLGIASLNDTRSINALERAINRETSNALKEDLSLVLNQLRATTPD